MGELCEKSEWQLNATRRYRKLLDECDLWCIVSLSGGAFTGSGAGVKTNLVFFTRGRKTERIWYYDLSHVKVGKKTPLELIHFQSVFDLLDKRGTPEAETERSWTVDFAERKRKAQEEAAPFRREAQAQTERAAELRERAKVLRRADKDAEADVLLPDIDQAEKRAREASARAQAIDDAVYDLKAVNPREKKGTDTRSPAELLEAISAKGRDVDAALERLWALL
jgi:type I restriction enzyme M protein